MQDQSCELYIISPETIEIDSFKENLKTALSAGDVAVFQLRLKNVSDEFILQAIEALLPVCREFGTEFILNDRPDLAAKTDVDGVHIGEDSDGTVEGARKTVGDDKIVGVSCYGSTDRAIEMAEKGADYVAFGAFYPTTTKTPKAFPEPEILKWWVENSVIPCVAIGGIKSDNCKPIVNAGADFVAVVSAIWQDTANIGKNVKSLLAAIK